jgi:hypothetical protein
VPATASVETTLSSHTRDFYREALFVLQRAGVPFLVGGAYALYHYTGIERHTKDIDVFVRPDDCRAALDALAAAGCRTEVIFPHWLAKAYRGDEYVDVIFSSGNAVAPVDDQWFAQAVTAAVLDVPVSVVPAEELIWQKSFIQERERYDGADVAHLIRAGGRDLDWPRLLARFGPNWRVLLGQLVMYGFVYPSERDRVPAWVMNDLLVRLNAEVAAPPPDDRLCRGTLLSREQYLIDVERWGYGDPRLPPGGHMTRAEIDLWTRAIVKHPSPPPGHVTLLDNE